MDSLSVGGMDDSPPRVPSVTLEVLYTVNYHHPEVAPLMGHGFLFVICLVETDNEVPSRGLGLSHFKID